MKLNQVTVGTTDYAASVAFYRKLGLTQIVDAPPRYARFETPSGETFSIHLVDEVATTTVVYFEVEDGRSTADPAADDVLRSPGRRHDRPDARIPAGEGRP